MDFDSAQVEQIATKTVNDIIGHDDIVYERSKVNLWTQQIIDGVLKELARLDKPFKYVITCIIQQNVGSGIQSAATAFWDTKTDGLISVQLGQPTYIAIVTVYAMQN